jgi:hypothetical protein
MKNEDLNEVFFDALDFIPSQKNPNTGVDSNFEPKEREILPYFKDPKQKISFWTILKDSIGKDITKLSVPVYFSDPMSVTQKCGQAMEYAEIMDNVMEMKGDENALKRLAYIGVFAISMNTNLERTNTKPFNPLLGETYELVTDRFSFLSEQVSHHPPITAVYCKGNSGY